MLEDELGYQSDQFEEEREAAEAAIQELEKEKKIRNGLADGMAEVLRNIEDAVIQVMIQLEHRNELDANGLIRIATKLHNIETLEGLPAGATAHLTAAKQNVQRLADRRHLQSANHALAVMCDQLGTHTQLVAELVLNKYSGQDDEFLFLTIKNVLHAIDIQQTLIDKDLYMDESEKFRRLNTLVASVWAQVAAGSNFPYGAAIVPSSDLDISTMLDESGKEDLRERVRKELEPRPEAEVP